MWSMDHSLWSPFAREIFSLLQGCFTNCTKIWKVLDRGSGVRNDLIFLSSLSTHTNCLWVSWAGMCWENGTLLVSLFVSFNFNALGEKKWKISNHLTKKLMYKLEFWIFNVIFTLTPLKMLLRHSPFSEIHNKHKEVCSWTKGPQHSCVSLFE